MNLMNYTTGILFKYSDSDAKTADTGPIDQIEATAASRQFYSDQASQHKILDAIESRNEEFRNAVRNLRGNEVVSDLPADYSKCIKSLWESKCEASSLYERDCNHSRNCHEINGCNCTSWRQIAENETKRLGKKKRRPKQGEEF